MNRKRFILTALLVLLALCLVYSYMAMPRLEKAPPLAEGRSKHPTRTPAVSNASGNARLSLPAIDPDAKPEVFPGVKRNIFRFESAIRRHPKTSDVVSPPPVVKTAPPDVQTETVPFAVVQQELSNFTFLGFLEKGKEKTVFLTSGGALFLARSGERFGAKKEFFIEGVNDSLLKVRRDGHEGLIEIPLLEKQKLAASVSAPARLAPLSAPAGSVPLRVFSPPPKPGRGEEVIGGDSVESIPLEELTPSEPLEPEPPAEGDVKEGESNGNKQP